MEGLKVADANLVVYLHPSNSNNVSHAILTQLSSQLFKFNEQFDGVLLAYHIKILGDSANSLPGIHPYFGVKLKSELLLFNPKPNMVLEGKVVKLNRQAVHIIVLGFSSAVIIEEDIREDFRYKIKHGKGLYASRSQKHHKIKVGTTIRFTVKSFDEEILHISGSLLPSNTGNALWLHIDSEDQSQFDSHTKKDEDRNDPAELCRRVNKIDHTKISKGAINGEIVSLNSDRQTKKVK